MKAANIKWMTLENDTGEKSLKQHAFIAVTKKMPWTGEEYKGNKSLCCKSGASEDGELAQDWETLEDETIKPTACKKCIKIYHSLTSEELIIKE